MSSSTKSNDIEILAKEMDDRASSNAPFTEIELQELQTSFLKIISDETDADGKWKKLEDLFSKFGHLSHKDWQQTGDSAAILSEILLGSQNDDGDEGAEVLTDEFKHMFHRVLNEGNWEQALSHSKSNTDKDNKPWAVLVTGVNGIRKTTSVYQSWFPQLLEEALIAPKEKQQENTSNTLKLPTGHNSFFRQLDHMIATISNNNFQQLYELTSQSHDFLSGTRTEPSKEAIQNYSNYKASIFKRYRTLSEILGITLINQAMKENLNVMIETSGRDVAMFHYIDMFFPSDKYNKLVLHFEINDLSYAEKSVDKRMIREMEDGVKVLNKDSVNVRDLINVNAGGPYGSEVLKGIQKDSDGVWEKIMEDEEKEGNTNVGYDWYKASIKINAAGDNGDTNDSNKSQDWTAHAIKPDKEKGQVFTFEAPRKV